MAHQNDTMDLETKNEAEQPTGKMPTRSSTHLAEKLTKLMETPTSESDTMDCTSDNLKKWTCATTPKGGIQVENTNQAPDKTSPNLKCSQNGVTPH